MPLEFEAQAWFPYSFEEDMQLVHNAICRMQSFGFF